MSDEVEVLDAPAAAAEQPKLSAVKVYNPIEEGLALMLEKHGHVLKQAPDVSTPALMKVAKANRTEMVKFRTRLEAARKEEKKASLEYGRLVDSEAARIQETATKIEEAYDAAITAEEAREQARQDGHLKRIGEIRSTPNTMISKPLAEIEQAIEALKTLPADFEEFQPTAEKARAEALATLNTMAERERELLRQAEELANAKAEQKRVAALRERIGEITGLLTTVQMCRTAERVQQLVTRCEGIVVDETFAELQGEAQAAKDSTLATLREVHSVKAEAEKQAADLAEQKSQQEQRDAELAAREAAAPPPPPPAPAPSIIVPTPTYSRRVYVSSPAAEPPPAPPAPAPEPEPVAVAQPAAAPHVPAIAEGAAPDDLSDADVIDVAANALSRRYGLTYLQAVRRLGAVEAWEL